MPRAHAAVHLLVDLRERERETLGEAVDDCLAVDRPLTGYLVAEQDREPRPRFHRRERSLILRAKLKQEGVNLIPPTAASRSVASRSRTAVSSSQASRGNTSPSRWRERATV